MCWKMGEAVLSQRDFGAKKARWGKNNKTGIFSKKNQQANKIDDSRIFAIDIVVMLLNTISSKNNSIIQ